VLEKLEKLGEEVRLVKENQIKLSFTSGIDEEFDDTLKLPMKDCEEFISVQNWIKVEGNRKKLVIKNKYFLFRRV